MGSAKEANSNPDHHVGKKQKKTLTIAVSLVAIGALSYSTIRNDTCNVVGTENVPITESGTVLGPQLGVESLVRRNLKGRGMEDQDPRPYTDCTIGKLPKGAIVYPGQEITILGPK